MDSSTNNIDKGRLQIQVTSAITSFPVTDATISISYTGVPESTLEQLRTNSSGQTETIELDAPPVELSMNPNTDLQPYSEYTLNVTAPGFESVSISGTEILADTTALQNITMNPSEQDQQRGEVFVIPAHTLYEEYPPKIPEPEIKPLRETGEIVLSRVVVPEYIVVHDGTPNDSSAKNYYVKYRDYIKNVASSEIFATWPANTIRANVLAIMSFTLNRVYTEWYRNQGYDFTITSSTAFDHKWIPERNYYASISLIVDELFSNYLSRPNVRQPILTQYCDGNRVSCPGWMTFLQQHTKCQNPLILLGFWHIEKYIQSIVCAIVDDFIYDTSKYIILLLICKMFRFDVIICICDFFQHNLFIITSICFFLGQFIYFLKNILTFGL